jgi:hypothetical protein
MEREISTLAESGAWGSGTWDGRRGEHPSAELLAAYLGGGLAASEIAPLQDHLAVCRPCAALVADLGDLANLPPEPGEPSDFEVAAAWRGLRARLGAAPDAAGAAVPATSEHRLPAPQRAVAPAGAARPRRTSSWRIGRSSLGWAAAASLLIASLVLGSWGLHLDARLDRLLVPAPNVPVVDLDAGTTRSGGGGIEVAAADPFYLLVVYPLLGAADRQRFDSYSWTLLGDDGGERLAGDGLELQHGDYFTLLLHRDVLPEGGYRIRITGHAGGASRPVGEQTFRVAAGG